MKTLKLEPEIIFDYYSKEVRPLLEQIGKILESILQNYIEACQFSKFDNLNLRPTQLCTNFAVKPYKSERRLEFFTPTDHSYDTRHENQLVRENVCRTTR